MQRHDSPTRSSTNSPFKTSMICRHCLRAAARAQLFHPSHDTTAPSFNRLLSTTSRYAKAIPPAATTKPTTQQGSLSSLHKSPAATSTSAAQPLSAPLTPSPVAVGVEPGKSQIPVITLSSTPAGTPLKGLNFLKSRSDPVALEDSEYPTWLWDILKKEGKKGEDRKEGDLFCRLFIILLNASISPSKWLYMLGYCTFPGFDRYELGCTA